MYCKDLDPNFDTAVIYTFLRFILTFLFLTFLLFPLLIVQNINIFGGGTKTTVLLIVMYMFNIVFFELQLKPTTIIIRSGNLQKNRKFQRVNENYLEHYVVYRKMLYNYAQYATLCMPYYAKFVKYARIANANANANA